MYISDFLLLQQTNNAVVKDILGVEIRLVF